MDANALFRSLTAGIKSTNKQKRVLGGNQSGNGNNNKQQVVGNSSVSKNITKQNTINSKPVDFFGSSTNNTSAQASTAAKVKNAKVSIADNNVLKVTDSHRQVGGKNNNNVLLLSSSKKNNTPKERRSSSLKKDDESDEDDDEEDDDENEGDENDADDSDDDEYAGPKLFSGKRGQDDEDDDEEDGEEDDEEEETGRRRRGKKRLSSTTTTSTSMTAEAVAKEEAIRAFRRRMGIRAVGSGIPDPLASFSELPTTLPVGQSVSLLPTTTSSSSLLLSSHTIPSYTNIRQQLLVNIEKSQYVEPTPIQMQAIPAALEGRDVLGCAPTGSGKTAAFLLPLLFQLQQHAKNNKKQQHKEKAKGKKQHNNNDNDDDHQDEDDDDEDDDENANPDYVETLAATGGGPRALILVPTKELAAQTVRECDRLSSGSGIRTLMLTKQVAAGTQGEKISVSADAPELMHSKKKNKKKYRGSLKDNKSNAHNNNNNDQQRKKRKLNQEEVDDEGDEEEEEEEESGDGSEDDNDDVLRWTDDEDVIIDDDHHIASAGGRNKVWKHPVRMGSTSSSKLPSSSSTTADDSHSKTIFATPRLPPNVDIIVATPLLLVAMLRHAKAKALALQGLDKLHTRDDDDDDSNDDDTKKKKESDNNTDNVIAVLPTIHSLILDEADKLLEMGFIDQVDEILAAVRGYSHTSTSTSTSTSTHDHLVQRSMFTATLSSGIQELALSVLRDPVQIFVGARGAAAATVTQKLVFVGREEGKLLALRNMIQSGVKTPALLFTQSKERCTQVHTALKLDGLSVEMIHSDLNDAQREAAISKFRRGQAHFLVTTDLLGRGLDFKGVNLVINFDFPTNGVAYIHRIGRTGRAGKKGNAITYFTEADVPSLRSIANVMRISGCDVPEWMLTLKKMNRQEAKKLEKHVPYRAHIGPTGMPSSSNTVGAGGSGADSKRKERNRKYINNLMNNKKHQHKNQRRGGGGAGAGGDEGGGEVKGQGQGETKNVFQKKGNGKRMLDE